MFFQNVFYASVAAAGSSSALGSSFFLWNRIVSTGKYRKNCTAEHTMVAAFAETVSLQLSFSINTSFSVGFSHQENAISARVNTI